MMRLIDADEFEKKFDNDALPEVADYYGTGYTYKEVLRVLNETPTADVELVKHGFWDGESDGDWDGQPVYDVWHCSKCGYTIDDGTDCQNDLPRYCPGCGAKMDEGGE